MSQYIYQTGVCEKTHSFGEDDLDCGAKARVKGMLFSQTPVSIRENHLSNTTCLKHVLFKRAE